MKRANLEMTVMKKKILEMKHLKRSVMDREHANYNYDKENSKDDKCKKKIWS